ncbi:MAG: 3-dehydroquinate synthase [Planctomycetes bacterium]|nr:3-dehydroquinate synthase [Planctomycetota bacterium]
MTTTTIEVSEPVASGESARYDVHIGPGVLGGVREHVAGRSAIVVTDSHVRKLHAAKLALDAHVLEIERGEAAKGFATLERVLETFAQRSLDRSSVVVALGGGSIGDLAGLAASLYMRGIECVQCPTTLLAQVDASVGGKTAINLRAGKNLAGTFHPPSAVFADSSALMTLDDEEFRSGLGEVLKSALLAGEDFTSWLELNAAAFPRRDAEVLAETVARSVRLKAAIVARDPRERGERKALNFGHTFAHAIEHVAGFGRVPHGVAVGVGIALAVRAGASSGIAAAHAAFVERVDRLLAALELDGSLATLRRRYGCELPARELIASMRLDKKGRASEPRFVLLEAPGKVRLDQTLPAEVVERVLA